MNELKHTIYQITNLLNGMIYIGKHSTTTPYDMKYYWGSSDWLKSSIKIHGKKNFKREILFVFDIEEEAFQKEVEIVDEDFVSREDTYNLKVGGQGSSGGKNHFRYGKHHTEETKRKISESHKGKVITEETRKKMSESQKGRARSEETKRKIGDIHRGKVVSKEARRNMSLNSGQKLSLSVIKQRRLDVRNEPKIHGWKANLSRMWDLSSNATWEFIDKYAKDIDTKTNPIIIQRRRDVKNIPKVRGWITELGKMWGISNPAAGKFIKRYALDLVKL